MDEVDTIVIGAGVVGLSIAARLAESREVLVLEKGTDIGQGISSRNSEVIHAGIYYPPSLKAELCVRGKHLLYQYCEQRGLPHKQIGKIIVAASDAEETELEKITLQAETNGVTDLKPLTATMLTKLEPAVKGAMGLLSPSTGIVGAHDLMLSLLGDLTNHGGQLAIQCDVLNISRRNSGFSIECEIESEKYSLSCRRLVLAAGLHSQALIHQSPELEIDPPTLHLCRGRYFTYNKKAPFNHLVYPVPEANTVGLGIHATLDLGGQLKFGPDTQYVSEHDYSLPEVVPPPYVEAIARYFPGIHTNDLQPGYAGIRPKLSGPGEAVRDFVIEGQADHGIEGFVQLFGIESPGLTASLAIAQHVEKILA